MSEARFSLPRNWPAAEVAKALTTMLDPIGTYDGITQSHMPFRDDASHGASRWQLDAANDHWLHVKDGDTTARIVSRYTSAVPDLLVSLFCERCGGKPLEKNSA